MVAHAADDLVLRLLHRDVDPGRRVPGVIERVVEQVLEPPLEQAAVGAHHRQRVVRRDRVPPAAGFAQQFDHRMQHVAEREPFDLEVESVRVGEPVERVDPFRFRRTGGRRSCTWDAAARQASRIRRDKCDETRVRALLEPCI